MSPPPKKSPSTKTVKKELKAKIEEILSRMEVALFPKADVGQLKWNEFNAFRKQILGVF